MWLECQCFRDQFWTAQLLPKLYDCQQLQESTVKAALQWSNYWRSPCSQGPCATKSSFSTLGRWFRPAAISSRERIGKVYLPVPTNRRFRASGLSSEDWILNDFKFKWFSRPWCLWIIVTYCYKILQGEHPRMQPVGNLCNILEFLVLPVDPVCRIALECNPVSEENTASMCNH